MAPGNDRKGINARDDGAGEQTKNSPNWGLQAAYYRLGEQLGLGRLLTLLSPIVKVSIKSRQVTVEGPRGKLTKDLSHLAVNFSVPKKNLIGIEIHHGSRKNVATLRTVRTLIHNLIIGVTKGFKYKMRYVYAHFPINVNVDKNGETGLYEVEIRYVAGDVYLGWVGHMGEQDFPVGAQEG